MKKISSPAKVKVGKNYEVPCLNRPGPSIPILSPSHVDGVEICANPVAEHYHVDKRFSDSDMDVYAAGPVSYRKMRCLRKTSYLAEPWFFMIVRLHELYKNATMKDLQCPHQGLPVVNDCGTCPGHGLIWNLKTKKLKYKLPFYVRIKGTECKGKIKKGRVKISVPDSVKNPLKYELLDSKGRVYPVKVSDTINFKMPNFSIPKGGATISIRDKNCGKEWKDE